MSPLMWILFICEFLVRYGIPSLKWAYEQITKMRQDGMKDVEIKQELVALAKVSGIRRIERNPDKFSAWALQRVSGREWRPDQLTMVCSGLDRFYA